MLDDRTKLKRLKIEAVEEAVGMPRRKWAFNCHAVSLKIVKSDLFERARVARGSCHGVGGQHSWVVLGDDCYDTSAPILDATLWSYDATKRMLWQGNMNDGLHRPKGWGSIWKAKRPAEPIEEPVPLDTEGLDQRATMFLDMLGPLDRRGWAQLFDGPMQGWPAAEIVMQARANRNLRGLIPVDILGMLTDVNPGGLYLKDENRVTTSESRTR